MDLVESSNRSSGNTARHPWELARFEVIRDLLAGTLKNDAGYTVLDIGCGDVFFVSNLARLYPKTKFYAIDTAFTDEMIESYRGQISGLNIHLFKTVDEASSVMSSPADLVLLLDVVEHIADDEGFLRWLSGHRAVSGETRVMITVPAYQGLFCSHDRFLGHYRRYTNRSLRQLVEKSGFSKLNIGYFFSALLLPRLLQVVRERLQKPKETDETTGLVEWNRGRLVTTAMKRVLLLDYKMTSIMRKLTGFAAPGLSNYILCKRSAS